MLHYLQVEPGHDVLEIGTGSGWNTALLAYRVGREGSVCSIEYDSVIAETARVQLERAGFKNALVAIGDGGYGLPNNSPIDRIIVTVGASDIPRAWLAQLKTNGILLLPFRLNGLGTPLLRLRRERKQVTGEFLQYSGFLPIRSCN